MRYCGNCGTPLDERSIANRRCTTCGTEIHASGDIPFAGDGGTGALTTPVTPTGYTSPYQPPPQWQVAPPPPPAPPRRGGPTVLAFVGGIVTTLVLLAVLIIALAGHPRRSTTTLTQGQVSSTATAQVTQATPNPGATATGQPTAGTTPQPTPTAATTPTPQATATPAPATNQGALSVQPQTNFSFVTCLNRSLTFDVANTGKGTLDFKISTKSPYGVNPNQGSLDGGERQTITISKINNSGTVIVSAPGAQNDPVTVTIHCDV